MLLAKACLGSSAHPVLLDRRRLFDAGNNAAPGSSAAVGETFPAATVQATTLAAVLGPGALATTEEDALLEGLSRSPKDLEALFCAFLSPTSVQSALLGPPVLAKNLPLGLRFRQCATNLLATAGFSILDASR